MSSSTDDRVVVGRIGRPHGVRGEITLLPGTDDHSRFHPGAVFRTDAGIDLTVRSAHPYRRRGLVLGFEGIDDRAAAEALRGALLTVPVDERRPLDEGEWWPEDLIGLEAVAPGGEVLGTVEEVVIGGFQDRLAVVTPQGRRVEVPFVEEIVGDPQGGRIVIDAPEGLFD